MSSVSVSEDELIAAVEAALAAVEVRDEESFRAALRLLSPIDDDGELVYEDIEE